MVRRRLAVAALLGCGLAGCGGPSPTRLAVTVIASPQANPNSDNQPSPTVVRLYDLRSADGFNSASFFDLYFNDSKHLGADLLSRRELEIPPGQTMLVKSVASPGTQYLAIMAAFRDLVGNGWRDVVPVATGSDNRLVVTLQPHSLAVTKSSSGFLGIF